MIEVFIIHIGMHKTGSSSIQEVFSQAKIEGVEYLDLGSPNHSGFMATMLMDRPELYHSHVRDGKSKEEVVVLKNECESKFLKSLSNTKARKVIISAEYLSSAINAESELLKLKLMLAEFCSNIHVIGYVRPPVAFMQSAFQQKLKGGFSFLFDLTSVYPYYKKRFQPVISVFGRDNVELIKYERSSLRDGDVVSDFASRIGVSISTSGVVNVNESISAEAISLLYFHRNLVSKGQGYRGYHNDNNRLVEVLSEIGTTKLEFSNDLLESVIDEISDDISWMNSCLGDKVHDYRACQKGNRGVVGEVGDLELLAKSSFSQLVSVSLDNSIIDDEMCGVVGLVDHLFSLTSSPLAQELRNKIDFFSDDQLSGISNGLPCAEIISILSSALYNSGDIAASSVVKGLRKKIAFPSNSCEVSNINHT